MDTKNLSDLSVDIEVSERKQTALLQLSEIVIWGIVALLPIIPIMQAYWVQRSMLNATSFFFANLPFFMYSLLAFSFPFFFKLIFDFYPLELARHNFSGRAKLYSALIREDPLKNPDFERAIKKVGSLNSHQLQALNAATSIVTARSIKNRAGAFILSGATLAFVGITIFLYLVRQPSAKNDTVAGYAIPLLQNFGVLFFLEFVALFLVRQYRPTMDEYRYFEAIARNREDTLVSLKILYEDSNFEQCKSKIDLTKVFSKAGILGKEETTELLEMRKTLKDEIVLLEKMIDRFGKG